MTMMKIMVDMVREEHTHGEGRDGARENPPSKSRMTHRGLSVITGVMNIVGYGTECVRGGIGFE